MYTYQNTFFCNWVQFLHHYQEKQSQARTQISLFSNLESLMHVWRKCQGCSFFIPVVWFDEFPCRWGNTFVLSVVGNLCLIIRTQEHQLMDVLIGWLVLITMKLQQHFLQITKEVIYSIHIFLNLNNLLLKLKMKLWWFWVRKNYNKKSLKNRKDGIISNMFTCTFCLLLFFFFQRKNYFTIIILLTTH